MKTITKITTQKKSKNRYNVFLDDQYAFSVSEDIFIRFHLHKGLELSEEDILKITQSDEEHRYYVMAIRYLSYRMRSEQEIRTYFIEKEVHTELIDRLIKKLYEEKLLDDRAFGKAFLHDRIRQTSKGPTVIAKELREKGVKAKYIEEIMKEYSYEEQLEKAIKFTEKQLRQKKQQSYQKQLDQLKLKLRQRGFTQDVVNDVFSHVHIEKDIDEEFAILERQADKLYERYRKKHTGYELIQKLKAAMYRRGFDGDVINKYVEKIKE